MTTKITKKAPYPKDKRRVHKSFTLDPEVYKKLKSLGHNVSKELEKILLVHFERRAS